MTEVAKTPAVLVAEACERASLPELVVLLNRMADDPRHTADDIGALIGQDPALVARLLRLTNSPWFGLSNRVSTVLQAIRTIGTKPLRDLVLALCAVRSFAELTNDLVPMDDFWYHGLNCAIAARLLARHRRLAHAETLFLAGLLHDVGQLVLYKLLPEASREALRLAVANPHTLDDHQAERRVHGFDHGRVGSLLLERWNLAPLIVEAVARHHSPAGARVFPLEAAMVHLGNVIATMAELDSIDVNAAPAIDAGAWKQAGVKSELLEPLVRETQRQFRDARKLFLAEPA